MKTSHLLLLTGLLSMSISSALAATCTSMGDTTYCDDDYGNTRVVGGYGDTVYGEAEGPGYSREATMTRYGDTIQVDTRSGSNTDSTTYGSYGDTIYRDDGSDDTVW